MYIVKLWYMYSYVTQYIVILLMYQCVYIELQYNQIDGKQDWPYRIPCWYKFFRWAPPLYVASFSPRPPTTKIRSSQFVWSWQKTLGDVLRRLTSSYNVARLHLITPMDFWQNVYPFLVWKIGDFWRCPSQSFLTLFLVRLRASII